MTVRQKSQLNDVSPPVLDGQLLDEQNSVTMPTHTNSATELSLPKICIFLDHMDYGGAQRVMLNLANGFASRGYPVDFVLVFARGDYLQQLAPGINIVDLASRRALTSTPKLAAYLRRVRPAVLLTGMYTNTIALWARRLAGVDTRVVISLHNTLSIEQSYETTKIAATKGKVERRFTSWADGIIAVSQGVADDFTQTNQNLSDRVKTIYNPVITPDVRHKATLPVHHPWIGAGMPPLILGIGRLAPQKNFATLIRAFAILRKKTDANLLILGEGPDRPMLERLVNELALEDSVQLPGTVENPYGYLKQAKLFVLSSVFEGLPTVLIEALYCGTAVVSTDCPSGPYEILDEGRYGQLVPMNDPTALAEAMQASLDTDQQGRTDSSWQRFELDVVVEEYLAYLFCAPA